MKMVVAAFGETEIGTYHAAYFCNTVSQLSDVLGNPPENSMGLFCAIQALMHNNSVIFFRVKEEGFSIEDYIKGFRLLEDKRFFNKLDAICLPGVGSPEILEKTTFLCSIHKTIIISTESDLYDYLTFSSRS